MSTRLPTLPSLREIMRLYGLRAQKHLSQNFLLQHSSINSVVRCAGNLRDTCVLEVGPGPGSLTRAILCQRPRHLVVVEIDRRFLPVLEELQMAAAEMGVKMDIYKADILNLNTESLFSLKSVHEQETWSYSSPFEPDISDSVPRIQASSLINLPDYNEFNPPRVRILGNLPFNISSPLIINWLHNIAHRRQLWRLGRIPLTLTFQKEFAERLVAGVWDIQRSRLSIMTQAFCEVKYMKEIPSSAFIPVPKVDAAVVRFVPLPQPLIPVPFPYVEKLVRHAFHYRQKLIARCLETLFPPYRPDLVVQLFKEAAVQPSKRPVQLSILEFRDLCVTYERICRNNDGIFAYYYCSKPNLTDWRNRKSIQRDVIGQSVTADFVRKEIYS